MLPRTEPLESRTLFASVTLITHGYQATSEFPGWVPATANAISAQLGGADIYRVTIKGEDQNARVESFKPVSVDPKAPRADAIVMLDWSDSSGVPFISIPGVDLNTEYTNTSKIASLVAPLFLTPQPGLGARTAPLAELPIHLIGHSRGGSLVSELAKALGKEGLWVDHLTTLDPRPVPPDPEVKAWNNVTFFDNYYEKNDIFLLNGGSVNGARNVELTDVFRGTVSAGLGEAHNTVQTFYGGTIPSASGTYPSSFAGRSVKPGWYATTPTGPRDATGFALARGGNETLTRPTRGNRFAGADRSSFSISATAADRWDNVYLDPIGDVSVPQGAPLPLPLRFEDVNADSVVTLYLDTDTNPYNGLGTPLTLTTPLPTAGSGVTTATAVVDTAALPVGNYRVVAEIKSADRRRLDYSQAPLTILPEGTVGPARALTLIPKTPLSYTDATGQKVTLTLSGPGSGTLTLPGTSGNADPAALSLTGTTAASSLSITSKSPTNLSAVSVAGPLKSLTAKTAVVSGLTLGTTRSLTLSALTGASTVTGDLPAATLSRLTDASLTVTGSLGTLKLTDWLDTDTTPDLLSVGSLSTLTVSGDFQADLTVAAGTPKSVAVRKTLSTARLTLPAGATTISLGAVSASTILAGFSQTTTPASTRADLSAPTALLKSVTVKGPFSDTLLATATLGTLKLGTPTNATLLTTAARSVSTTAPKSTLTNPPLGDTAPTPGLTVRVI